MAFSYSRPWWMRTSGRPSTRGRRGRAGRPDACPSPLDHVDVPRLLVDAEEDPLAVAAPGGIVEVVRAVHPEGQVADAARRDRDHAEQPVVAQEEDFVRVHGGPAGMRVLGLAVREPLRRAPVRREDPQLPRRLLLDVRHERARVQGPRWVIDATRARHRAEATDRARGDRVQAVSYTH